MLYFSSCARSEAIKQHPVKITKSYSTATLLALTGVFAMADELQKIEPMAGAESHLVAEHFSLEAMVKEFGLPGSKLGAFVSVPTDEELPDSEVGKVVHFSQSDGHSVSVPYNDGKIAVVVAAGENRREGYCTAVFLVAINGKPDAEFGCRINDCVRHSMVSGYSYMGAGILKLPQFSKPLLHICYFSGGRQSGEFSDEWFRMDRGKFEPVLALRTGQYQKFPSLPRGVAVSQETTFRTKGGKLIAKSERTTEFLDKLTKSKNETFETVFSWSSALGKFTTKNSKKLELRD